MILQLGVSRIFERFKAMPSFMAGLLVTAVGVAVLGMARAGAAWLIFVGIFLFAIGEMISSPRIQEYITWIAPKEKAGLYMGSNFLSVMIGGFTSGFIYTTLYGASNGRGRSRAGVVRDGRAPGRGSARAHGVPAHGRGVPRAGGLRNDGRPAAPPSARAAGGHATSLVP